MSPDHTVVSDSGCILLGGVCGGGGCGSGCILLGEVCGGGGCGSELRGLSRSPGFTSIFPIHEYDNTMHKAINTCNMKHKPDGVDSGPHTPCKRRRHHHSHHYHRHNTHQPPPPYTSTTTTIHITTTSTTTPPSSLPPDAEDAHVHTHSKLRITEHSALRHTLKTRSPPSLKLKETKHRAHCRNHELDARFDH